jgi:hypothetical protein
MLLSNKITSFTIPGTPLVEAFGFSVRKENYTTRI